MAYVVRKALKNGKSAYLVRFTNPTDGVTRSRQFARRKDADAFASQIEVARNDGTYVDPRGGRITMAAWWARWWPTVTELRPSTRSRDETCWTVHIEPRWGNVPISRIDRTSAREWIAQLASPDRPRPLSASTVAKIVQVASKTLRAAVDDRLIPANPFDGLKLPRIQREEMRFITGAEVRALADAIDPRYRALVLLGAFGGLRIGEMLGLRWGNVDLLRRHVDVRETLVDVDGAIMIGPPKTPASVRTVKIPPFVCEELARLAVAPVNPSALVFTSPLGHPVQPRLFRQRYWRPAVAAVGLEGLRVHDLRHTAISLWIADGANPKQVAVRAGHTSVSVVLDRYGHLYEGHDDELIAAQERRWRNVQG